GLRRGRAIALVTAGGLRLTMRVVVLGAGAIGRLLGWGLAHGGADVRVVGRAAPGVPAAGDGPVPATVRVVDGAGRSHAAAVEAVPALVGGPEPDLVVCAVKMTDLDAALRSLDRWPIVPLLTIQNGIGAEALARAHRPAAPLMAGSVTASASRGPDGVVRWLRRGGIGLAPAAGPVEALLPALAERLRAGGLPTMVVASVDALKWSKLLANLLANASSAILDMDPAAIYADPGLFDLERRQLREALAVMAAQDIPVHDLPGAPVRLLALGARLPARLARPIFARAVGGARGGKSPSLRLHVAAGGGPSEVEWLNGAVVEAGARLGLPTPANRLLLLEMREVTADAGRRAWYRGHPERLLALQDGWHTGAP
ncbi:MAG: ketopantoate reductase family protein, partial [Candidatus Limnocylindrales bacterium]